MDAVLHYLGGIAAVLPNLSNICFDPVLSLPNSQLFIFRELTKESSAGSCVRMVQDRCEDQ